MLRVVARWWHGLLLGSTVAMAMPAMPAHALLPSLPPVPTPSLPVPTPSLPLPPVPTPSVPSLPTPPVPTPSLPVPSVPKPSLPTPSLPVPKPSLPKPSLPTPSLPKPSQSTSSLPKTSGSAPASSRSRSSEQSPAAAAPRRGSVAQPGAGSAPARVAATPGDRTGTERALQRSASRRRELPPRRLRRLLQPLAGCVDALGPLEERVLVRRAGLRGFPGQSRTEVARSLRISRTRVTRVERRALKRLRRLVRTGRCDAPAPPAEAPASAAAEIVGTPAAATGQGRIAVKHSSASGGSGSLSKTLIDTAKAMPPVAATELGASARRYADDHPFQFGLAVLVTLLSALLLVRELRRERA